MVDLIPSHELFHGSGNFVNSINVHVGVAKGHESILSKKIKSAPCGGSQNVISRLVPNAQAVQFPVLVGLRVRVVLQICALLDAVLDFGHFGLAEKLPHESKAVAIKISLNFRGHVKLAVVRKEVFRCHFVSSS